MKIEIGSTPEVDTNKSTTDEYKEVHRKVNRGRYNEAWAEDIRDEILVNYSIPAENVFIFPEVSGRKREIRVFTMLTNKITGERFYADGHTNHATLLDYIFEKFQNQVGELDRKDLPDDFDENWKITKGFIDPYQDGFKNFPSIRASIIRLMETKEQNGLTEQQVEELKKDPENGDVDLPNWFKSI